MKDTYVQRLIVFFLLCLISKILDLLTGELNINIIVFKKPKELLLRLNNNDCSCCKKQQHFQKDIKLDLSFHVDLGPLD